MSLQIHAVGVIGAGTMGNGIAQVFAAAGYPVTMRDLKPEFLDRGMASITKSLDRLVSHQKLMPEQRDAALSRIRPTIELKELAPCEIIVEAILEDYELKASLIRELDAICRAEAIGVARTKHLAKIASQVAKPDGLVVVDPKTELDFLHDLPVELMWGVGPLTRARLAEIGVHTIGQLVKMPGYLYDAKEAL